MHHFMNYGVFHIGNSNVFKINFTHINCQKAHVRSFVELVKITRHRIGKKIGLFFHKFHEYDDICVGLLCSII